MGELARFGTVLLDFDDTLVFGPLTWGIGTFLPEVMARHGLTPDRARLNAAVLAAQEMAAAHFDDDAILSHFLAGMDWPKELWDDLAAGMRAEFAFALFDDTLPFLLRLRER